MESKKTLEIGKDLRKVKRQLSANNLSKVRVFLKPSVKLSTSLTNRFFLIVHRLKIKVIGKDLDTY